MKNRLTKSQLQELVREQLTDEVRQQIDEGIWDSIKYGIAKLGSLEASGKLLGKDKIRKAAQDKLEAALDKHSNKAVKDLIDAIKADEDTKEFPNMKDQFAFQSALASILVYYDSLKAAVEKYQPGKEEQPEGAMSPEAANAIIEVLHQYLVNVMDNKLSDVYKHFKESLEEEGKTLAEIIAEQEEEDEEGDEGEKPEEFYDKKSTTMAGLESNFLPAALMLLGGGAYSAGQIVAATAPLQYTRDFITDPGKITQIPGETQKYFDAVVDSRGNGMLKTFSDSASSISGQSVKPVDFVKSVDIIAKQTGQSPEEAITNVMGTLGREKFRGVSGELSNLMYQYAKGGGGVGDVVNATAIKPEFIEFAQNNGASEALMSQIGGAAAGSGAVKDAGMTLLGMQPGGAVMTLAGKVAQGAAKQAIKTGAVTMGAKATALVPGLGAILGPMGLTVAAGGAAIKALRVKGKKSSRAADLQTARDYIKKFPVEDPVLDPEGATGGPEGEAPEGEKPVPDAVEEPEGNEREFAGIGRMDDDGLKISVSRSRSKKNVERDKDIFQQAQDQAITGRNSKPSSDQIATKFGIKPREPDVGKMSHSQMQKAIKGKSKAKGDAFLTVDASVRKDLSAAIRKAGGEGFRASGQGLRQIQSIVKTLLNRLVKNDKKQTAGQARVVVNNLLKKIGVNIEKADMDPIIKVLQDYGLVRSGDETGGKKTRSKRTKGRTGKKRTPATSPATDDDDDEPAATTKKQGSVLDDLLGVDSGIKNQRSRGARAKVRPPTDAGTMRRRRKTRGGRALEEQSNLDETLKKWAKIAGILQEKNDD